MKIRKSDLKKIVEEVIDETETSLDEAVPASARGAKFKNYKGPKAKKEVHKDLLAVKRFVDVQQDKKALRISKTLSRLASTISLDVVDAIDALKDNE